MNNRRLIYSLLSLLIALLSVYLYVSIEVYEEERDVKLSFSTWRTPYLAAQKLVQKQGGQFESLENYRRLFSPLTDKIVPEINDTIILTDAEVAMSDKLAEDILDWIYDGGHLIFAATHSTGNETGNYQANALFDALNISINYIQDEEESLEQTPTSLRFDDDTQSIKVNFENSYRILFDNPDDAFYQTGDDNGTTFAQIERGEGLISIMTEVYVWNNQQIGLYDNLVLLDFLTANADTVYLFRPTQFKHWSTLVHEFSPTFIFICLFTVALSIWRYSRRLGPILVKNDSVFSGFSQHIKAAGEYYWRSKKRQTLLADMRHLVLRDVAKKWPNSQNLPLSKQIELLNHVSGWDQDTIEQLLCDDSPLNEAKFTQYTKAIQQLRNML